MEKKIKKLNEIKQPSTPILSIYLGQDGKKSPDEKILHAQLHTFVRKLEKKQRDYFKKDISKIEAYLKEAYNARGKKSIAIFTNGNNLWEILEFEYYIPSSITVDKIPYLEPIQKSLNSNKKYLVLVVDRKKARLFTVHLGKIEEHTEILDPSVPQKVKANEERYYGRSNKIFRHIEDHLNRHMHLIADKVSNFAQGKDIKFVIIGGHKELFSKIKEHLKYPLSKKVIGTFVTELNIPINEILKKTKKLIPVI